MKIQESAENYLEAILIIKKSKGAVRSIDVAHNLGFSKPSVSYAMKQFRENGYIIIDDAGNINLTKKGLEIAERIYRRHQLLTQVLIALGVSEETAKEDACKIEHHLSNESFDKLLEYMKKNNLLNK